MIKTANGACVHITDASCVNDATSILPACRKHSHMTRFCVQEQLVTRVFFLNGIIFNFISCLKTQRSWRETRHHAKRVPLIEPRLNTTQQNNVTYLGTDMFIIFQEIYIILQGKSTNMVLPLIGHVQKS